MIVFTQTGQAGKTKYLLDMHRLRKLIFADRMGWDVDVMEGDLEVDDFDIEDAVYLLALEDERVCGSWRLLPTTGPTMIRDVWPEFLETIDMPSDAYIWEASRFGVFGQQHSARKSLAHTSDITRQMFQALTQLCIQCGITHIFTLYDKRIARLLRLLNCQPEQLSEPVQIDGKPCWVGSFKTDYAMLKSLQDAGQDYRTLYDPNDLPPRLEILIQQKGRLYA